MGMAAWCLLHCNFELKALQETDRSAEEDSHRGRARTSAFNAVIRLTIQAGWLILTSLEWE